MEVFGLLNEAQTNDLLICPGETLKEVLEERKISTEKLSQYTGYSQKHIESILSGNADITEDFALKLEDAIGIESSLWLNLQKEYNIEKKAYE